MALEQSILTSTKKLLNIGVDDTSFDHDIITHINSAFSHLQQLGIGPEAGFQIEDATPTWVDFLPEAPLPVTNAVKTNIVLRVRSVFDPPQLPHLLAALERALLESDWRLNTIREESEWVDPDPPADLMVVDGGDPSGE